MMMNKKAYSFKFDDVSYLRQLIYDIKDNIEVNGSDYVDDNTTIKISKDGTSILVTNDKKQINTTVSIPDVLAGIMMNLLNTHREEVISEFLAALSSKIEMEQKSETFDDVKAFITLFSSFEEPEGAICQKIDDLYLVPKILYAKDGPNAECNVRTIAVTGSHLKRWNKTADDIFEIGWNNLSSSLTFEQNSQNQLLFSIRDKKAGITLMAPLPHVVYSEKFRRYIGKHHTGDVYISFPKPYIGFVWSKDMVTSSLRAGNGSAIKDCIYKHNMSVYFDPREREEGESKLLYRLYRIPADITREVEVYQF